MVITTFKIVIPCKVGCNAKHNDACKNRHIHNKALQKPATKLHLWFIGRRPETGALYKRGGLSQNPPNPHISPAGLTLITALFPKPLIYCGTNIYVMDDGELKMLLINMCSLPTISPGFAIHKMSVS